MSEILTEEKSTSINTVEPSSPIEVAKKNCAEIARVPEGNTNQIAARLQEMMINYYQDVRKQGEKGFRTAWIAAIVGMIFLVCATAFSMWCHEISIISLIAGGLIQFISAINFVLYGKTARQFSLFHVCLERTNRFILANTLCENISCSVKKDSTRQLIIESIINAPLLNVNMADNKMDKSIQPTKTEQDSNHSEIVNPSVFKN